MVHRGSMVSALDNELHRLSTRRWRRGLVLQVSLEGWFDGNVLLAQESAKQYRTRVLGNRLNLTYFNSNFSFIPPIVTSNSPGSTIGLLLAPINERSSRRSMKVKVRLWPGSR